MFVGDRRWLRLGWPARPLWFYIHTRTNNTIYIASVKIVKTNLIIQDNKARLMIVLNLLVRNTFSCSWLANQVHFKVLITLKQVIYSRSHLHCDVTRAEFTNVQWFWFHAACRICEQSQYISRQGVIQGSQTWLVVCCVIISVVAVWLNDINVGHASENYTRWAQLLLLRSMTFTGIPLGIYPVTHAYYRQCHTRSASNAGQLTVALTSH